MYSNIYVNKLPIQDSAPVEYFTIRTIWETDVLILEIVEPVKAWKAMFRHSEMAEFLHFNDALDITFENYIQELKEALTTHKGVQNCFYSIHVGRFNVKKTSNNSKLKTRFASISIAETSRDDLIANIIDATIDYNQNMKKELAACESTNSLLNIKKSELIEKLNQYRLIKTDMEENLFGKFIVLLNAKKDRIKVLEECLKKAELTVSNHNSEEIIPIKKARVPIIDSDSESFDKDFGRLDSQNSMDEYIPIVPKRAKPTLDEQDPYEAETQPGFCQDDVELLQPGCSTSKQASEPMLFNTQDLFDE